MRFGLDVPNSGHFFDARALAEIAREAEDVGWDGLFIWDHLTVMPEGPGESEDAPEGYASGGSIADPWIALSAVAMRTERIRIGTMVTPVPRRRPWKLARETVSLDHLSNGRLILGVGLGAPPEDEYEDFGEDGDARVRAGKLDEGLEVLTGLWSGREFSYEGKHFVVRGKRFLPTPLQSPRIPVWVGGMWPNRAPFRRAARWDGVYPITETGAMLTPDDVADMVSYVRRHRTGDAPFDVAVAWSRRVGDRGDEAELVARYARAGATWCVLGLGEDGTLEEARELVRKGPPAA